MKRFKCRTNVCETIVLLELDGVLHVGFPLNSEHQGVECLFMVTHVDRIR